VSVSSWFASDRENGAPEVLWEDGERVCRRMYRTGSDGATLEFAVVLSAAELPDSINRLAHEYELKDCLDSTWAVRPLELVRDRGQTILVIEFPRGEPLYRLIGTPMDIGQFLRLAVAISVALGRLHGRGLIHKDIKPANILVNSATGEVWLTGFGIASRLPRERQTPVAPESIAGTLAYMAPEQTGRMNRSVDSRSDLYSLGITLYEMLTGTLPFTASNPIEWVHCHIARQPALPSEHLKNIPGPVSAVILKLLAKVAEGRYQTAAGVESDLRHCLSEWDTQGRIDDFKPGEHDTPDRLQIPERLYGRDREINTLLAAFNRIVAGGRTELVLVSGYSGIGKSAVVNELHKSLVPPRGLFSSGKFDQYKRDIPYATLAQAFQNLIRPLLNKSDEELRVWRDAIREAIDPNGSLIVDLVPGLKHIIGEQPSVSELPPQDAQTRFHLVFRRFISVFARPEHPLALFLDDLQWLDAATLDLLEDLLTRTDLKHLLLIGAYRDNEVSVTHPLIRKLDVIRQAGAILQEIVLTPLVPEDMGQLLADSLGSEPKYVAPLAQLIREKTAGNPFFAIQFIASLADENLLTFDYDRGRWSWELSRIYTKGYTDNVVDLMVGKLNRLSVATQQALQQFACLGNSAEFGVLRMLCQDSMDAMHDQLWDAVRTGLVFRSGDSYQFLHDRVQEAAYSLMPKEQRAEAHLRIGTLLAENTSAEKLEEAVFEIVNQLNRGSHLITSTAERERVAELNLMAARRAKASTAYTSALRYLGVGRALLTEATWELNYDLTFAIECLMAECELLTADMVAAENRLTMLAQRAGNQHDFAVVTRLRLTLYTTLDQSDLCVDVFLDYLRRGGTVWSRHPTRDEVLREHDRIWTLVGNRQIEQLLDLPLMTDPDVLDTLDVFTEIVHPAFFYDENFSSLVVCRMVSLSLEHGNCDASCFGYVWFAMFAGPRFNNYKGGYRFGQLGFDLVEKRGLVRYQARTYLTFATLTPWAKHAASARSLIHRAFDAASRAGDLTFSAYSWEQLITNCLMVGDPLADVQSEADNGIAFAKKSRFGLVVDICSTQLALIRTLRGLTPEFGCFNDDEFDELRTESHLASNPVLSLAEFFYWTRKLQARVFAGDYAAAVAAAQRAQSLVWTASSQVTSADFPFYGALAHAASWGSASADERQRHFEALTSHHKQLEVWSKHCPENFENRAALVGAEIARIESRTLDAEQLYENAIRSARANSFVHNEALANEHAARFYAARGFSMIADAYLRNARNGYKSWGAIGKVRQLEAAYPQLHVQIPSSSFTATIDKPVAQFDVDTVVKASQTLSSEINLSSLIEKLMRLAVEHAGAERGLLILMHDDGPRIEAEAISGHGSLEISAPHKLVTPNDLPLSTLQYVFRTRERVLIDDAPSVRPESEDEYIRHKHLKSILCLPILKQKNVVGALYLENNLTTHAFTSGRIAVLDVLASQAAISLENARLYASLSRSETSLAEAQRLSSTGSFLWRVDTGEILWSRQTHRIFDTDPEASVTIELAGSRIHPEDLPLWHGILDLGRGTGSDLDHEFRLQMLDGSVKHLHFVAHATRDQLNHLEYIGAIQDVTERRLSEAALGKVRSELAHVSRVSTLGNLSASIAHELNQPLSGVILNASTCLRRLAADPPNVDGAAEIVRRVIRDANRASDVINRLRALFSKKDTVSELVDLNGAARELVALLLSDFQSNRVTLRSEYADDLPLITGDRVQLQQVILNLLRNAADAMTDVNDRPRDLLIQTELEEGGRVRLTVKDSGIGFSQDGMDQLFNAFYTTKSDGMGMGLSVSRSIIESHNGRLWATPNDGPGVTFSFSIPVTPQV
jgi:predicted ATPase/signal transduction histidine kinase